MVALSIIVPVYNSAHKGLSQCIQSILEQNYKDFELIIVNDGSTDNSLEICESFGVKDERIRIIHKENHGVSAARNTGLSCAKGEFITFVDSDDYINPDYLSGMMEAARNTDLVVCGLIQKFKDGKEKIFSVPEGKHALSNPEPFHRLMRSRLVLGPCNKIFKSSIIKSFNLVFPEDMDYGEDRIFCFDYLKHIRDYAGIGNIYYNYMMQGGDSLSSKPRNDMFSLEYSLWIKLYELYEFHNVLTKNTAKDLYKELFWLVNDSIAEMSRKEELTIDNINSILSIPHLSAARKYTGRISTNRVIKWAILNRWAKAIILYYRLLKLCRK